MTRRRRVGFLAVLLAVGIYVYRAAREPNRPDSVPSDATYVPSVKRYYWVNCWLDKREQVNRCKVFNSDGTLFFEDGYLPYNGAGPIPDERFKISARSLALDESMVLKDGTYLVRQTDFERHKKFLDDFLRSGVH